MKPMPYTPYEHDEFGIYRVRFRTGGEVRYLPARAIDTRIIHKRLSDAECAAEYWHAAYYSVQPFFAAMVGDLEVTDEVNEVVTRQATEAQILRRFHDNPHAFGGEL